ncbi:MAG TPA: COR domain-containing protein, partial [Polyangiaceae bacterium]
MPEALPTTEPDGAWPDEDVLRFRYEYELLPVGLVPQLIVEAHRLLDRERPTCWRLGAVFHHADCKALVRADRERGRIDIAVWGPDRQRRSALNVVCVHLDGVHASHKELGHAARVPLPEQPDVTVGYEHLLRLEQNKGSAYLWLPEGAEREYTVAELLDGVRREEDGRGRALLAKRTAPVDQRASETEAARAAGDSEGASSNSTAVGAQPRWERIAVFVIGVAFVLLLLGIALFVPHPTTFQLLVFRVVLA